MSSPFAHRVAPAADASVEAVIGEGSSGRHLAQLRDGATLEPARGARAVPVEGFADSA